MSEPTFTIGLADLKTLANAVCDLDSLKPPLADLRLAARWIAEQASPGRIAVAVPDRQPKRRRHGRIVLLDPVHKLFPEVSP